MSVFGVSLVRMFMQLRWIRRDTDYLAVFIPDAEKYGPENFEYVHFSRRENCQKDYCFDLFTYVITYISSLCFVFKLLFLLIYAHFES